MISTLREDLGGRREVGHRRDRAGSEEGIAGDGVDGRARERGRPARPFLKFTQPTADRDFATLAVHPGRNSETKQKGDPGSK